MRALLLTLFSMTLVLFLPSGASAADAQVHRWVDEDGMVHYEDQPPTGTETEQLNIIPPASGTLAANSRDDAASGQAGSGGTGDADADAAADDGTQALRDETAELIRQRQCEVAQRTREQYQGAGYLFQTNADGTQSRLNEEERAAALSLADQDVANFCGGG
jgi:hypothetical protein